MQEEVIQCLPEQHILQIIDCLEHSDPTLRKLAAKFLLDLVHDNYLVQLVFCDILGLIPCDGKVCINSIPEAFKNVSKHIPECLEALKTSPAEETQGSLPYCWYLHIQDAEKSDKNVVFIPNEDKDEVAENNAFFDPHFSMLGFVMRGPRKENNEKPKTRVSDVIRPASSYQPSMELGSSAVSVGTETIFQRTQPDMKAKPQTASNLKGVIAGTTNKRKTLIKNPIAAGLQSVSTRMVKSTVNSSLTSYFPKTEKSQNNRTTVMSTEAIEDMHTTMTEKETRSKPNSAKKEPVGTRLGVRKTEPTIEPLERFQESKLNASINEMSETQSHEIEGSLRNSQVFPPPQQQQTHQETLKGKSKTVKVIKTPKGIPEKTLSYRDKNTSSMLTTDDLNSSQLTKNKLSDIDKRLQLRTPKGNTTTTTNPSSASSKSATNTNLLNKILKSKPAANDRQLSATQASQKQGIDKASFWDFIYAYRKLNATALSSVMTSSTKATKTPLTNYPKKEDLSKTLMSESNLPSKKKATHTSLIQSGELMKSSLKEKYEALDEELSLDIAQPTPKENVYSSRKSNIASAPLKNYHISAGFKNPIASSRVSQEIKKENLTSFGKLLSPRRSHDVTYLANHKKKVDASASIQGQKNNKKVAAKKVNQTMAADSPRIK